MSENARALGQTEIYNKHYMYESLPGPSELDMDGLFGSNGEDSRHVFGKRFEGLFDESPCEAMCFGE